MKTAQEIKKDQEAQVVMDNLLKSKNTGVLNSKINSALYYKKTYDESFSVNYKDNVTGNTFLLILANMTASDGAQDQNHANIINLLLNFKKGKDLINAINPNTSYHKTGKTPLMLAIANRKILTIKALVETGKADLDIKDNDDKTSLMLADSTGNNTEITEYLIKQGAKLNLKDKDNGYTALMLAVSSGNVKKAILLINAGADLTVEGNDGRTALMIATANGYTEITEAISNKIVENNQKSAEHKVDLPVKSTSNPTASPYYAVEVVTGSEVLHRYDGVRGGGAKQESLRPPK
jgi:ankyrin repeat protein